MGPGPQGRHVTKTRVVIWKGNRSVMDEFWGISIKDLTRWLRSAAGRKAWGQLKHGTGDRRIVIKLGEHPE